MKKLSLAFPKTHIGYTRGTLAFLFSAMFAYVGSMFFLSLFEHNTTLLLFCMLSVPVFWVCVFVYLLFTKNLQELVLKGLLSSALLLGLSLLIIKGVLW